VNYVIFLSNSVTYIAINKFTFIVGKSHRK
jgi:hypothetical protein